MVFWYVKPTKQHPLGGLGKEDCRIDFTYIGGIFGESKGIKGVIIGFRSGSFKSRNSSENYLTHPT